MAAVLPFLETEEFHFPEEAGTGLSGLGSLAAAKRTDDEIVAASNMELTKLLWLREVLQKGLAGKTFQLVFDRKKGQLIIRLSSPLAADTVPWYGMQGDVQNVSFFSTNTKMRCPTFDLPAGSGLVGGACPAAGPAQTTSIGRGEKGGSILKVIDGRSVMALYPDVEFNLARSVCASCYATGGSYGKASTQLSELVHFAVMKAAILNPAMQAALIEALVWQIPNLPYAEYQEGEEDEKSKKRGAASPDEVRKRMALPRPSLPNGYPNTIRIHSSGDFFDQRYARMWLEIARRVYQTHGMNIIFWAPTRTQFLPTWAKFWSEAEIPPNFTIRPSAYHVGDSAPMAQNLAAGTSVLTPEDSEVSKGEKFDHQCGVYDLDKGNRTCVEAKDPEGKPGCRACWVRPELRVNYVAH
jgi:hypothetical protein